MKTLVVKIVAFTLVLALCIGFVGCDTIVLNSYAATMFIRNETRKGVSYSFASFNGKYRTDIHADSGRDTDICYSASLDEGEISVYFECATSAGKTLLFTLKGGESIEDRGWYVGAGMKVRIYLETPEGVSAKGGKIKVYLGN